MQKLKIEKKLCFDFNDQNIIFYKTNLLDWDDVNIFICNKHIELREFCRYINVPMQSFLLIKTNDILEYTENKVKPEYRELLYNFAIKNNYKFIVFVTNNTKIILEECSSTKNIIKNILKR